MESTEGLAGAWWHELRRVAIVARYPRTVSILASSPGYSRSLYELGREFGFPVVDVPNVNSLVTLHVLRELSPDLGVSLGNRVIYEEVFSLPRLGTINLHHGRIPGYRGGPPTFWELYNGEQSMGVRPSH